MSYQYIIAEHKERVLTITMNRPEVHNAFNEEMIVELTKIFKQIPKDCQLIVLTGAGKSFSAGADLTWMKSMKEYSMEENKVDSLKLAELFNTINSCPKPIMGKINGHALGGGVGLVSVCDYAIVHDQAKLGFTEVNLGLIPAVISPFVIAKIGESHARALFLSGEKFSAKDGAKIGLVHKVTTQDEFEEFAQKLINQFLSAGPNAQIMAKDLIKNVLHLVHAPKQEIASYTASQIAKARVSIEGQEGMTAILEKRKPKWIFKTDIK